MPLWVFTTIQHWICEKERKQKSLSATCIQASPFTSLETLWGAKCESAPSDSFYSSYCCSHWASAVFNKSPITFVTLQRPRLPNVTVAIWLNFLIGFFWGIEPVPSSYIIFTLLFLCVHVFPVAEPVPHAFSLENIILCLLSGQNTAIAVWLMENISFKSV